MSEYSGQATQNDLRLLYSQLEAMQGAGNKRVNVFWILQELQRFDIKIQDDEFKYKIAGSKNKPKKGEA